MIKSCPNCKKEPYETRNFSRIEKNLFNSIKIKCPNDCGEILSYETYCPHLNFCKNNIKTFKCQNCEKKFETKACNQDIVNEHLNSCEKICKFCREKFNLLNFCLHERKCLERILKIFSKFLDYMSHNQESEDFKTIMSFIRKFLTN